MQVNTKLSVITINYNDCKGLKKTIDSVRRQSNLHFEYIVIDGSSNDGSLEIIKENEDVITYWVSEKDSGIYNAMNKGIKKASGEYLLFLNSGDYFYDNTAVQFLLDNFSGEDLICCNQQIIGEDISYIHQPPQNIRFSDLFFGYLPHASTCIKNELFQKVGLYDESLKIVSDWKFMILALFKHNCTYKKHEITITTFTLGGISSKINNDQERMTVLNEFFPKYVLDYKELKHNKDLLNTNRYKMLTEMEKTTIGKKIVSLFFRGYLFLFSSFKIKYLLK